MNQTRKNTKCTYCEKEFPKRQQAALKKLAAMLKKHKMKSFTKKAINRAGTDKKSQEMCKKGYCNPTCEGTIFESGKAFPKSVQNETQKNFPGNTKTAKTARNSIIGIQKFMRKKIFGKKTNVLKDGFYEKLSKKTVADLKKSGAISGCAAFSL
jgi:hypothetical protein